MISKLFLGLVGLNEARRHLHNDDFAIKRLALKSNDANMAALVGTQNSPLVEATDCTEMCVFKDNTGNEWCFKFQSPALTSGWKWKQATSDGYFRYQFVPYFKPAFYMTSEFTI